ncbi:MAG TPA: hypothetical protein VLT36_01465 [Candidatus Dormibacteraeota bacterium]|nr:hypothetical protein [Candidatus Dormibacteraeota bacterium]
MHSKRTTSSSGNNGKRGMLSALHNTHGATPESRPVRGPARSFPAPSDTERLMAIERRLSVIDYQLTVIGYRLGVISGHQFSNYAPRLF